MTDDGVALARRQLLDLVEVAGGAVMLLKEQSTGGTSHVFQISLDTSGLVHGQSGVQVRARERFNLHVTPGFPFARPEVHSVHKRWSGTPHVQWDDYLCLYAAPSVEWNPADGMRGLIQRLSEWVERAAAGTLDPDGQPLHPPAVYSSRKAGTIVVRPDLGDRVPWTTTGVAADDAEPLVAWCAARPSHGAEVLEWLPIEAARARVDDDQQSAFDGDRPLVVIPTVLVDGGLGFEYPQDVASLSTSLTAYGYGTTELLDGLIAATVINKKLRRRQVELNRDLAGATWDDDHGDEYAPLFTAMLLGTPSRRVAGDERLAHLAAWRIDTLNARVTNLFTRALQLESTPEVAQLQAEGRELATETFASASISWMRVLEARPEVTVRRDRGTPSSWVSDKRVLVMGCGALGAPVAEFCVRAGAQRVTLVDSGIVTPGIIVRQPYSDADIGVDKSRALAARLLGIRTDVEVWRAVGDVRAIIFGEDQDLSDYDLVIDATADATVRAVLEQHRRHAVIRPPVVTMVIGHEAQRGLVTVNLPAATGAGVDTFRKVSLLAASGATGWTDIGDDLFPRVPRTDMFFPEPGCSSPTFVGSAAQTSALAGMMLDEALMILAGNLGASPAADASTSFAAAVRLGDAATTGTSRAEWVPDVVAHDASGHFEVRFAAEALAEVRAEVRRGARARHPEVETGGMLLGAFDDATGVVYVDRVAGPPPDSYLSELHFEHGLEGTQARVDDEVERTARTSGFLGYWHTHPDGVAFPSPTDEQGMASIVSPDGSKRRAVMAIFGGKKERWAPWRDSATGRPDLYVRVVPRASASEAPERPGHVGGLDLQRLPPGLYFRGGYRGRVRIDSGGRVGDSTAQRTGHRWWPWGRR